jgi:hypothetical protein
MLSRPQGHRSAGSIRSTEKINDPIGIQSRDLPACSIVPHKLLYRVPLIICRVNYTTHLKKMNSWQLIYLVIALLDPAVSSSRYVATSFRIMVSWKACGRSSTFLAFAWETEESRVIPQSRESISGQRLESGQSRTRSTVTLSLHWVQFYYKNYR